jgi:O-antigen ligase
MKEVVRERLINIIDKVAFFFFIVLVFFLPISKAAIESSFGFIFLMFIIRMLLKRPTYKEIQIFFKNRINLSLLIFYVCIGLSLIISGPLFKKSLHAWIFKWGEGFLLFYFAQIFLRWKHIKILLSVFIFSTFIICIDGLYQKISGIDFMRGFDVIKTENFAAIRASFSHYNDFASFIVAMFFINCGILLYIRKFWLKLVLALLSLLIVVNLLFTYSRAAWVSFLVVCLLLVMFSPDKKTKLLLASFMAIFILGVIGMPSLRERFLLIVRRGGAAGRFEMWKAAILMFKDSPLLGKGLGTFMDYLPKYSNLGSQYTHNCYLQILAETGLLGLVSFLWFLGEIITRCYKRLIKNFDILFLGVFLGFLAFLIHSFFDTQLYSLKLSILFWLLASFLAIYTIKYSESNV